MKIRTVVQLSDVLSTDLIWRKKEMSGLLLMLTKSGISSEKERYLLRSSIALLYAHWEGYIKAASHSYIEFVHFQKLAYRELAPNFIALSRKSLLSKAEQSNKAQARNDLVQFFTNELGSRCVLPYKDGISTYSNLSSEVLKDIVETLGLSFRYFETKATLIDETLLKRRNGIAHGEYMATTTDLYRPLHADVLSMLDDYKTQIENAAILKSYLK